MARRVEACPAVVLQFSVFLCVAREARLRALCSAVAVSIQISRI
jgi:hypothetical protein